MRQKIPYIQVKECHINHSYQAKFTHIFSVFCFFLLRFLYTLEKMSSFTSDDLKTFQQQVAKYVVYVHHQKKCLHQHLWFQLQFQYTLDIMRIMSDDFLKFSAAGSKVYQDSICSSRFSLLYTLYVLNLQQLYMGFVFWHLRAESECQG